MVVVIELCDGWCDQTATTRTSVDRCGAIMAMRMCDIDSVRGRDHLIVITLINGHA